MNPQKLPKKLPTLAISRSTAMPMASVALLLAAPHWAIATVPQSPTSPIVDTTVAESIVSQVPDSTGEDRSPAPESIPQTPVLEAGTIDLRLQHLQRQNLGSKPFSVESPSLPVENFSLSTDPENQRLVQT
ncbi:MAG: hypothetical protein WBB29_07435, partial [Geitlerinemataceae cyanobacterium]